MTKAEAIKMIEGGTPSAIVEYRSGLAETISYRDKTTGRTAQLQTITHAVEAGPVAVQVRERVPDGKDVTGWVPTIKKGTPCLLVIESWQRDKGVYKASGVLHPLT